ICQRSRLVLPRARCLRQLPRLEVQPVIQALPQPRGWSCGHERDDSVVKSTGCSSGTESLRSIPRTHMRAYNHL
ncbi:hypothetical protein LEMLEM_LOCUS25471, partial [Lemmus lemmus]